MKVTLNNKNAGKRLSTIRESMGLNKKELAEKLDVTISALYNIGAQERLISVEMVIKLIDLGVSPIYIYYGVGSPMDQRYNMFLESYSSEQKESEVPIYLEEYIIKNLKRQHKLERNFLNLFFPVSEFISRYLKEIDDEYVEYVTVENAKMKLIKFLQKVKLNKYIDSDNKREKVILAIEKEYSKVEIYVLLKHKNLFL